MGGYDRYEHLKDLAKELGASPVRTELHLLPDGIQVITRSMRPPSPRSQYLMLTWEEYEMNPPALGLMIEEARRLVMEGSSQEPPYYPPSTEPRAG